MPLIGADTFIISVLAPTGWGNIEVLAEFVDISVVERGGAGVTSPWDMTGLGTFSQKIL